MQQDRSPSATRDGTPRVEIVDLLRGFVIVLMILDHTYLLHIYVVHGSAMALGAIFGVPPIHLR